MGLMLIETTTFRVADDAGFVEVDARFQQEVAYQRPGLVRRTTARADDGQWIVITIWESPEAADAAGAAGAGPLVPDGVEQAESRRYTTLD